MEATPRLSLCHALPERAREEVCGESMGVQEVLAPNRVLTHVGMRLPRPPTSSTTMASDRFGDVGPTLAVQNQNQKGKHGSLL